MAGGGGYHYCILSSGSSIVPGGDGEQPALKRPRKEGTSEDTSGHVVGYNKSGETEFPWFVPIYAEAESVSGMLCSLCKRYSTKNKYNRSTTWSGTPDCVRRHFKSEQYQGAVELEKYCLAAEGDGGIPQALQLERF